MCKYLLIAVLLTTANAETHTSSNASDIFIVAKNEDERKPVFIINEDTTVRTVETTTPVPVADMSDDKEDVVFVPNENKRRNRDEIMDDAPYEDLVQQKSFLRANVKEDGEDTESPTGDVLFVSGKHDDDADNRKSLSKMRNRDALQYIHQDSDLPQTTITPALDCVHLDCDDTADGVCGVKIDRGEPKYRLFFNECFYRKVNCEFRYEENRYKLVSFDKCEMLAGHLKKRDKYKNVQNVILYSYMPSNAKTPIDDGIQESNGGMRRQGSGRRSMYMDELGSPCGHDCPVACTSDYDPQCAMTLSGEKRVFANHCQLDMSSCNTGTVWRQRLLHECVGGQKADLQNNRAFVNWMQRIGIVDKKGRLNLNK